MNLLQGLITFWRDHARCYAATGTGRQTTVDAIQARRAAGERTAKTDYVKLDEMGPGFRRTTHMMMPGTNSLKSRT